MKVYLKIFKNYEFYWLYLQTKQVKHHSINDKPSRWCFKNKQWFCKVWYKNNKLHRETGPAFIRNDGYFDYYLDDKSYKQNKQEWEQELLKLNKKNLL